MDSNRETNNDSFGFENQMFLTENEFPFEANNEFENAFESHVTFATNQTQEEGETHETAGVTADDVESVAEAPPPPQEEQPMEEEEAPPLPDIHVKEEIGEEETQEEPQEDQFSVEAIVGKRKIGRRVEYHVKWLGFTDAENTWEPIENLNCQELIAEYETKNSSLTPFPAKRGRKPRNSNISREATPTPAKKDGFARGLKAKRVVGVSRGSGDQLEYSVEFEGVSVAEVLSGRLVKQKCPDLVISFLQSKLTFNRKGEKLPLESYRPLASKQFSLFRKKD